MYLQGLSSEAAGGLQRGLEELGVRHLGPQEVLQCHVLPRFEVLGQQARQQAQQQPQQSEQDQEDGAAQDEAVRLLAFCCLTGVVPSEGWAQQAMARHGAWCLVLAITGCLWAHDAVRVRQGCGHPCF